MDSARRDIARFRRDVLTQLTLRTMLTVMLVLGLVGGVVVLGLRYVWVGRTALAWGLLSIPAALVASYFIARRRVPSVSQVRALMDSTNRAGGLLMLSESMDVGPWAARLSSLRLPTLHWDARRHVGLALLGLAFLAAGFLIPDSLFEPVREKPLNVEQQVKELAGRLDVLEEEKIVEADQAAALREDIDRVQDEAAGEDPARTWEALDHLSELLKDKADRAAEDALKSMEQAAKAETLASALKADAEKTDSKAGGPEGADGDDKTSAGKDGRDGDNKQGEGIEEKVRKQAMEELAKLANQAGQNNPAFDQLPKDLREQLRKMAENGGQAGQQLNPQQLEQLRQALQQCRGNLQQQMGRLAEKGMIDPALLKMAQGMQPDPDAQQALLDFLEGQEGMMDPDQLGMLLMPGGMPMLGPDGMPVPGGMNLPGDGGINRGRGDAELFLGNQSDSGGTAFKEQVLPPGRLSALKDSKLLGVSKGAPGGGEGGEASVVGALKSAAGGTGSAHTQPIPPRHHGVVKRYFDRDGEPK